MTQGKAVGRAVLLAVPLMLIEARPSQALPEFHLVKWKKTAQCEIVTTLPLFGSHWDELGVYPTKREATFALEQQQRLKICPDPKRQLEPHHD